MRLFDVKKMLSDISFPSLAIIVLGTLARLSLLLVGALDLAKGFKKALAEDQRAFERML